MAMEAKHTLENRRAYTRVDVYIPVAMQLVPDEARESVTSRISGKPMLVDSSSPPLPENHPQREWIKLLNGKMDKIIHQLTLQSELFHSLPFKYVTISGSGMMFSSSQAYAMGDLLEVKMMLTLDRPIALYLYGEVIKVQKQTSGYFIAISFQKIDEAIRDRIIQFVFETERELLRERCGME